jgi:hypothetical protein
MEALLNRLVIVISISLQLITLFFLIKRGIRRRFFWFFLYITYEIIQSGLRLIVPFPNPLYSRIYWWTEIADIALMVLAFRESFRNVFREYARLRWFVSMVWACIGAALLYALFKAVLFPPVQAGRRSAIIIGLEVAVNFALSLLGTLYFASMGFFKIREHQWESGVISGFTIYVALSISAYLVRSVFGTRFGLLYNWLGTTGYILAQVTWILEFSRQERPVAAPIRDMAIQDMTTLNQYIKILGRLLGRKT